MAYLNDLANKNPYNENQVIPTAFSSHYPAYEINTPQYPAPSPFTLANQGYRLNELVFACIQKRMSAISEPPMLIYDNSGETPEEIKDSPLTELIKNPCEGVTEKSFWQITELNLLSCGFTAWEKERNRMGDVIHLWPMRPDWCSFYRGEGRPIRAIRYQPYGLPFVDIPRENVVLFQYFDPLYPLLKGLGPTAIALQSIGVDNATTAYLKDFFRNGSVIDGLLSSDQTLNDIEARRIQDMWSAQHGGSENWASRNIAVVGNGAKYQSIGTNFKDMAFQELDGRNEARICAVFKVPPILIGAKVGLTASTYSNYEQARQAFYEETISPEWEFNQAEINSQVTPEFYPGDVTKTCVFNTKNVQALQDNKDAAWKRADEAAKLNIITRDEARQEMGKDPIDNTPVFVGIIKNDAPGVTGEQPQDTAAEIAEIAEETDTAAKSAKTLEIKRFREFASKRVKEGHAEKIHNFKFQFLTPGEQSALFTELPPSAWRQYP